MIVAFVFLNLFAVSAEDNETVIDDVSVVNETASPAVSIETSVSDSTIYIGNSTEVTITVKNVGNCDVNNISIINLQAFNYAEYLGDYSIVVHIYDSSNPYQLNTLHFNNLESIDASWNYTCVNDTKDKYYPGYGNYTVFYLEETLKVNQSSSFKVSYNTTKTSFYEHSKLFFFIISNNTLLNKTSNTIKISQIPRTVYINRKIQNGSLIVNATVSSLDNSVFSGGLSIKVADNHYSPIFPEEVFDEVYIRFVNNTGNASIKLPLTVHRKYPTGVIFDFFNPQKYSVYSYKYVYDSFNEWSIQNKPRINANDLVKVYHNESQFTASPKFILDCNKITFKVNGVTYVREVNESGFATLNINLSPGVYEIVSGYVNENFIDGYLSNDPRFAEILQYSSTNTITVLPTLIGDNLVKYYMNDSQFNIKLVNSSNNPVASQNVTFNINGVFYSRQTDEEGIARLNINLPPGEYVLTATDPLTGLNMSYNITVLPVLYGEDIISFYKGDYDYSVKLVDDEGNAFIGQQVTFNINGLIFNNVTDENGVARIYLNLMPGKYIVTAQYLSNKISNCIFILGA